MNKQAIWFRRAVWLGILADWLLGIPVIFAPEQVLRLLGFRPTGDPTWTAFSGLLVVLLSLLYIPGAGQPYRNRFNAWLAVFARPPGVLFFLVLYPGNYAAFGILDGVLFLIQFPLLLAVLKAPPPPEPAGTTAPQAPPSDHSAVWLKRTVWLGILADWLLGVPAIFAPTRLLALVGFRPTGDPVWTAFAALILVLLGVAYIPGGTWPYRYRSTAWLAVFARPPGVIFFFLLRPGLYPQCGLMDGFLFLIQFPFLLRAMQLIPERRFWDTQVFDYHGATYREVKEAAFGGPYPELPKHKGVGPGTFLQFFADSARNLYDKRDIRPHYDKLIHSHGVCYAGRWQIDQDSPYSGYFARGAEGLVIVRISVAGPFIHQGSRRSLGIAGKIFPTLDPEARVWPANFVTVSHLSGSKARAVLDIVPTNYPTVGADPAANLINRVIFRVMDTRPGYRQLFPISTLGVAPGGPVATPDLMQLKIAGGTPRVDAKDFRDEIRLARYPGGRLVYDVEVKNFADTAWQRLGSLTLSEDTVSEGSDKRLHFWIPRDIPNLPQTGVKPAPGKTG